jgi:hypothetical protein
VEAGSRAGRPGGPALGIDLHRAGSEPDQYPEADAKRQAGHRAGNGHGEFGAPSGRIVLHVRHAAEHEQGDPVYFDTVAPSDERMR